MKPNHTKTFEEIRREVQKLNGTDWSPARASHDKDCCVEGYVQDINLRYLLDKKAGVIYMSFGAPQECTSEEHHGVLIRLNKHRLVNGLTILDTRDITD